MPSRIPVPHPKQPRADLHTHTTCSDGRLSPAELVAKAVTRGLKGLAVTDHDSFEGYQEAERAARDTDLNLVTGVELSVTVEGRSVHLLGYGFDPYDGGLQERLFGFRRDRQDRSFRIIERLHALGVPVDPAAVQRAAKGGAVGRVHVAVALVEGGFVGTVDEAFARFLRDDGPAFVDKPPFEAREALDLLHAAGGVGVLAHPGLNVSDDTVRRLLQAGLDGIETIHPSHTDAITRYFRRVVRDHSLLETGGSDYHGYRPTDEENFGAYTVSCADLGYLHKP